MAKKKPKTPNRWRTKEARAIARAVSQAGGSVERTGIGHMKIKGPKGVAVVSQDPGSNSMDTTLKVIRDKAGLDVSV